MTDPDLTTKGVSYEYLVPWCKMASS
ncbi:unnamed protein product [Leptidea sinapis]|uniref:Uncharacterized protein n=1 Tax=Leptidea sinapis TaxID=189913 RepID=A0A5E4QN13_9NEOP|nr:unnamed protein product [Leptidea sinapis]